MLLRLRVRRAIILFFLGLPGLAAQPPHTKLDIHYARGSNQTLDLYLPAGKAFTPIVYTYGGHSGSGKSSAPDHRGVGASRLPLRPGFASSLSARRFSRAG
jgi:hypothetical protein